MQRATTESPGVGPVKWPTRNPYLQPVARNPYFSVTGWLRAEIAGFSKYKAIHSKFWAKFENEFVEKVLFSEGNSLYLSEQESEDADDSLLLQPFDDEKGEIWKFVNLSYF